MKVRYTERAAGQIAAALDYIEQRPPQGAAHVSERLAALVALLQDHPHAAPAGTVSAAWPRHPIPICSTTGRLKRKLLYSGSGMPPDALAARATPAGRDSANMSLCDGC